jgi:DNA-binding NarL/FixJ family response regulator
MQSTLTKQPKLELHQTDDRPLNVLILDDLDTDRVRLRRLCRKSGLEFDLFEAEDLKGFREVLDNNRIDIAFLDYRLAMDNGLDALKILTTHEDQVHAIPIMVTSVEDPHVIVEAMRSGCADYLTKEELSVEAVRKSVASAFERRMLIAALNEAQSSRNAMRMSVSRIAKTCGPEIRSIMSGTIRHIRTIKQRGTLEAHVSDNFSKLEQSCMEIFRFLDELKALLDGRQQESDDGSRALIRRPVRQALPAPGDRNVTAAAQDEPLKEQATSDA